MKKEEDPLIKLLQQLPQFALRTLQAVMVTSS